MMKKQSFYRIFRHEGLTFGWKHAKKDFFFFLQIFALMALAGALPTIINIATGRPSDAPNFGDVISFVLSLIFGFGIIKIWIDFVRHQKADLKLLIDHNLVRFLWWILARIVSGLLVVLGLVLLIIPGIYVAARLYLVEFFVVDQNMSAIEAISASWEVTKGHVWEIIAIWILTFGVTILGALALGIGLLWAMPTVFLAQATLYKKLTSHDHHEA